MFINLFKSKLTQYKEKFEALREHCFWAFDKTWNQAIDTAIADNNADWLEELYSTLTDAIENTPHEFPLWFILPVPREIEDAFAQKSKQSDHKVLHWSLAEMVSDDQEKVVKALITFWYQKAPNEVPPKHIAWALPTSIKAKPHAQREVIPHGAVASVEYLPKVNPISLNPETDKVKKILIASSKVRFIGAEGCGKTSKARWLCRERIAVGHKVFWINPHLNADDKEKLLANGVTIIGGGRDYAAIGQFCTHMVDGENSELSKQYERYGSEVGARFESVTFVLDELTNYKDEVGEPIEKFIKSSMQEFSKIAWHTVYITHNDTLSCMGAPNGTANLIKSSVFDLRLETDILKGNRVPKAIAKYRMPNSDNWADVTIPVEWQ